jgi:hypothetical protein
MKKITSIILIISILLFTGCNTNQVYIKKNNKQQIYNYTKSEDNTKKSLSKKEICTIKTKTIKRWKLNYKKILLDKTLTLNELMKLYNGFNQNLHELNITNCDGFNENNIKYDIFILTKPYIIELFLKNQINEFRKLKIGIYNDFNNLIESEYKEQIVTIANSYGDEMNGFTPFTTDEEIWKEKLNIPLHDILNNINNNLIQLSDKRQIELLVQIYKNFIIFANKYHLYYKRSKIPNFDSFSMYNNDYVISEDGIDKSEKGFLWNSFVDIVELTPIVGDAISLGDCVGLDLKSDKNTKKALKFILNNLNSFKKYKLLILNNDIKKEIKFLINYYNELLIYKE